MTTWRFSPHFLLRATGFPIERLTGVAATEGDEEARVRVERLRLFEALSDEPAREALMTSAPLVDDNFEGWWAHARAGRRNAQDKKRERVLWRFLQRLTAKNDSTSFFGAVALGDLRREEALGPLPVEASRRVFSTQWVVEQLLGSAIAQLRDAGLHTPRPRRAPGADAEGRVWEPGGKGFVQVDAPAEVDVEALPSGLVDPVGEALARLREEPPSALRDAWITRFEALEAGRRAFAATAGRPAERRAFLRAHQRELSAMLGEPAVRNEGEFYASRGPLHEQADRTGVVIGLPEGWAQGLEDALRPTLDLSLLAQAADRAAFRAWFEATFEGPVLWREVLQTLGRQPHAVELGAPAAVRRAREVLKEVKRELRAQIDDALARGELEARLSPHPAVMAALAELAAEGGLGVAYANPDLMIAREAAGPLFVLAEAHHLPHLTGCLLPPLAQAELVIAATREELRALTAPDLPAFPVSYDHSFISVGPDLGAVGLELSGLAREPLERRATFAELTCEATADGLRFTAPSHAGELLHVAPLTRTARLHLASPSYPLGVIELGTWLAGPDWRAKEALPRIVYGGLVVHRRRFRLRPEDLAARPTQGPREVLAALSGLPVEGVPRFMFMRVASEPKPILVDWASALSTQLALWSLGRGEALELSEMLPGPEACWLEGPGGHYTSELRTVIVRR